MINISLLGGPMIAELIPELRYASLLDILRNVFLTAFIKTVHMGGPKNQLVKEQGCVSGSHLSTGFGTTDRERSDRSARSYRG